MVGPSRSSVNNPSSASCRAHGTQSGTSLSGSVATGRMINGMCRGGSEAALPEHVLSVPECRV